MLARDVEAYDAYCDATAPDACPVCGTDCRCDGPHESIATAIVAAAERLGTFDPRRIYAREDARAQLLAILHTLPDDVRGRALQLLDRCCP